MLNYTCNIGHSNGNYYIPSKAILKETKSISLIYIFFTQNITDYKDEEKEFIKNELK